MKTSIKIVTLFFSVLTIFPFFVHGQNSLNENQKRLVVKPIDSVINRGFKDLLKDSIGLYAFNFKLEIVRKGEKTEVIRIDANDSLAYKLFPSYKRFYSINYRSLIGDRKKIVLVIPILISNVSATAEKKYKNEDGTPLIDMNAAVNAAIALTSTVSYNNIKDVKTDPYDRISRSKNYKKEHILNPDKVFLPSYFIKILKIQ